MLVNFKMEQRLFYVLLLEDIIDLVLHICYSQSYGLLPTFAKLRPTGFCMAGSYVVGYWRVEPGGGCSCG